MVVNPRLMIMTLNIKDTKQTIAVPLHDIYLIKDTNVMYIKNKYTDATIVTLPNENWEDIYNVYNSYSASTGEE